MNPYKKFQFKIKKDNFSMFWWNISIDWLYRDLHCIVNILAI